MVRRVWVSYFPLPRFMHHRKQAIIIANKRGASKLTQESDNLSCRKSPVYTIPHINLPTGSLRNTFDTGECSSDRGKKKTLLCYETTCVINILPGKQSEITRSKPMFRMQTTHTRSKGLCCECDARGSHRFFADKFRAFLPVGLTGSDNAS